MMDKYDHAMAHLGSHPDQIYDAWSDVNGHPAGCLFAYVSPDGHFDGTPNGKARGCLTQIKLDPYRYEAWTDELNCAIAADSRIPASPHSLVLADLPIFAEWQRRIDKALNRSVAS
jgi:hypothetical protein